MAVLGIVLLAAVAVSTGLAQSQRTSDLAAGKVLVAARNLPDPNFGETVVLLVKHDDKGAMGLVLTRESRYTVGRLFPDFAKGNESPIYVGGPVSRTGVIALGRSQQAPKGAESVLSGVWMSGDAKLVERLVREGATPENFRLYLGYSGWAAGQLEGEVRQKVWHIFPGDAGAVFAPEPAGLWKKLIRRTELEIARRQPTPGDDLRFGAPHSPPDPSWDGTRREQYLLRPEIAAPWSDRMVWPSLLAITNYN